VCHAAKRFQLSRGDKLRPSSPISLPPSRSCQIQFGGNAFGGLQNGNIAGPALLCAKRTFPNPYRLEKRLWHLLIARENGRWTATNRKRWFLDSSADALQNTMVGKRDQFGQICGLVDLTAVSDSVSRLHLDTSVTDHVAPDLY
jgi:hypothetical protein